MIPGRTLHNTLSHGYPPDGRQFVACACPVGEDHPAARIIVVVELEEGADGDDLT